MASSLFSSLDARPLAKFAFDSLTHSHSSPPSIFCLVSFYFSGFLSTRQSRELGEKIN